MCPLVQPLVEGTQVAIEGRPSNVVLLGPTVACAGRGMSVSIEVVDPDGNVTAMPAPPLTTERNAEVFSVRVPFTPERAGRWSVTANWTTGGKVTRNLEAARAIPTGPTMLRRFIDRMDNCARGPFRTNAGLTLCERAPEIWSYSVDGQVQEHFVGSELAVRGDEIWSRNGGELEHRTALPGALRLDGTITVGFGAEGATLPNVAIRGDSNGIREITWNGTALSSRTIAEGYAFDDGLVIIQNDVQTWSGAGCLVERGCSQTQCPPVRSCTFATQNLLSIDEQAIWSLGPFQGTIDLIVNPRPLSIERRQAPFMTLLLEPDESEALGRASFPLPVAPMTELPRIMQFEDVLVLPRLNARQEIGFVSVRTSGKPLTVTADWVVSQGNDLFTLLATQMPPLE